MNRITSVLAFIAVIAQLLFLSSSPALAHVAGSDGPINVVVHVEPSDDPIVGQEATIFYEITDQNSKFDLKDCTCVVIISSGGKELFRYHVPSSASSDSSMPSDMKMTGSHSFSLPYTFPAAEVYSIRLTAQPKTSNAFHPFDILVDFRVTREETATSSSQTAATVNWLSIAEGGGVLLILVIPVALFFIHSMRGKLKRPPAPPPNKDAPSPNQPQPIQNSPSAEPVQPNPSSEAAQPNNSPPPKPN